MSKGKVIEEQISLIGGEKQTPGTIKISIFSKTN